MSNYTDVVPANTSLTSILVNIATTLTAFASLLWQVYDKILAKPKLSIKVNDIRWRLVYTPNTWPDTKKTWCRPYGTVIRVPVENRGRTAAKDCRPKLRYRMVTLRGDTEEQGDWSDYYELHWSENPEGTINEAYKPIAIGRDDTAYIDLMAYHTRLANPPGLEDKEVFVMEDYVAPEHRTILAFYAKPFTRGELPDNPCGWNPRADYSKIIPQTL